MCIHYSPGLYLAGSTIITLFESVVLVLYMGWRAHKRRGLGKSYVLQYVAESFVINLFMTSITSFMRHFHHAGNISPFPIPPNEEDGHGNLQNTRVKTRSQDVAKCWTRSCPRKGLDVWVLQQERASGKKDNLEYPSSPFHDILPILDDIDIKEQYYYLN